MIRKRNESQEIGKQKSRKQVNGIESQSRDLQTKEPQRVYVEIARRFAVMIALRVSLEHGV